MVRFYELVQDQVTNLTPFGTKDGVVIKPRLEGWLAGCELFDVPRELRANLIRQALVLHGGLYAQLRVSGLTSLDPAELTPPDSMFDDGADDG